MFDSCGSKTRERVMLFSVPMYLWVGGARAVGDTAVLLQYERLVVSFTVNRSGGPSLTCKREHTQREQPLAGVNRL